MRLAKLVVNRKSALPVLSHIKVSTGVGNLVIQACNLDQWLRIVVPAETDGDGAACLPLGACTCKGADTLEVTSGKLATLPAAGFPSCPDGTIENEALWSDVSATLRKVSYARSTEDTRYVLNGVYLAGGKVVATDGRRLALADSNTAFGGAVILPRALVGILETAKVGSAAIASYLVKDIGAPYVRICWHEGAMVVTLTSKSVEGSYPNYKQVIPLDSPLCTGNGELLNAWRTMLPAVKASPKAVSARFIVAGGRATIVHRSPERATTVAHAPLATARKAPYCAAFNPQYMADALAGMIGEVAYHATDELSPIKLIAGDQVAVVCSMRMT